MKSLQNYGVQELDTRELQTIDGGDGGLWRAIGYVIGFIGGLGSGINDPLNSEIESNFQCATGFNKV